MDETKGSTVSPTSVAPTSQATCVVIRSQERYEGKQGLTYFAGVSAESAGAKGLCLHLLTLPPGAKANAHLHENHESAVYVVSGRAGMWFGFGFGSDEFGERLADHVTVEAGDFIYIPPGVPHLPYNLSETEACVAVIARTDPNEQESVLLLPGLLPPT